MPRTALPGRHLCNSHLLEIICLPYHDYFTGNWTGWALPVGSISIHNKASVSKRSGSIFGKMVMRVDCPPAQPGYLPTTYWGASRVAARRSLRRHGAQARYSGTLDLLVGILSACKAAEARQTVRDTWMRWDIAALL